MTTAHVPLARTMPATGVRSAIVTTSLCVSAGVHAALAAMHAGGNSTAEFVLFEAAALAALATAWLLGTNPRAGAISAVLLLSAISLTYGFSRIAELPVVGHQAADTLGLVTVAVQLVGIVLAATLLRTSTVVPRRAPLLICALIVAYSFLAAYAIPSVHHHGHSSGHSHATTT
jgi:hypothetical protein